MGKSKAHVGKMDEILTDSHLDIQITRCILMNLIVPTLKYAQVWERNAKFVKQLESVQMTAAQKLVGCSSTTSTTSLLRAELGMYPLKSIRDVRKLKWQYKVMNMPRKSLPAITDRAVWEKATKGRAGIRWDSVLREHMERYHVYIVGVPPVRLPGRVLPATGSGSDPKPAWFFGPGTRVPRYPFNIVSP